MNKVNKYLFRLIAILCMCVLTSTVVLSGLLARYTTSDSTRDTARVITFGSLSITETGDFVQDGNSKKAIITPGTEAIKDINITFTGSEAKTYLFVDLSASSPWVPYTNDATSPLYMKKFIVKYNDIELMSWSVSDEWNYLNGKYIYYKEIEPNSGTVSYDFIADTNVDGDEGKIVFSENITDIIMKDFFGVPSAIKITSAIDVKAYVVQASGFDSVENAWKSVSKN